MKKFAYILISLLPFFVFIKDAYAALKSTTVEIGGVNAVLIKADSPIGSLIMLAGGDGVVGQSHHGFLGIDPAVVNLVIKFAKR